MSLIDITPSEESSSRSEDDIAVDLLAKWKEELPTETRVRCIETGQEFETLTAAAKFAKQGPNIIRRSIMEHRFCGGYHFVRAEEDDYTFGVEDLPGEKWFDIPGLEGLYQFSSRYRVKSLQRTCELPGGKVRTVPEQIVADTGQYKLYKDNEQFFYTTRRLKALIPQATMQKSLFKLDPEKM